MLLGSGQLGILSSVELRNELALMKLHMELLGKYEEIQTTFIDTQMSSFLNQSVDRLPGAVEELEMGEMLGKSRHANSYDELLKSREFSNLLVDLIRHTRGVKVIYTNLEKTMSHIDSLTVGS